MSSVSCQRRGENGLCVFFYVVQDPNYNHLYFLNPHSSVLGESRVVAVVVGIAGFGSVVEHTDVDKEQAVVLRMLGSSVD